MYKIIPLISLTFLLIGCGGKKEETKTEKKIASQTIDLATKGEKLFYSKGCNACHYPDKERSFKLVGPGLKGITNERSEEWLIAIIVNPDSMLKNDPEAQKLLKEYGTPMPNQGVTVDEAKAIIAYLRKISKG